MGKDLAVLAKELASLRDIADFCEKWPTLKKAFDEDCVKAMEVEPEAILLIVWLYKLADKVCPGSNI